MSRSKRRSVKIRDIAAEFLGGSQGSRADAVTKYGYGGTGDFLKIEGALLTPQLAAPGITVEALVSYVVWHPMPAAKSTYWSRERWSDRAIAFCCRDAR